MHTIKTGLVVWLSYTFLQWYFMHTGWFSSWLFAWTFKMVTVHVMDRSSNNTKSPTKERAAQRAHSPETWESQKLSATAHGHHVNGWSLCATTSTRRCTCPEILLEQNSVQTLKVELQNCKSPSNMTIVNFINSILRSLSV